MTDIPEPHDDGLNMARGVMTGIGYSLIPWSVILLIFLSWVEWGY